MTGAAHQALSEAMWQGGAVTVSAEPITLKSGRISHVYVSLRHFACDPKNLALLTGAFGDWLQGRHMAVATVSSLLSPVLSGAVAARFGLPLVLYRPDNAEKGLAGCLFGRADAAPVVLLDDVLTSGSTALAAAKTLREHGVADVTLFVFVDKRPVGLKSAFPLAVAAPLTLERLLRHGLDTGRLTGRAAEHAAAELAFLAGK